MDKIKKRGGKPRLQLEGKIFNRLTVIKFSHTKNGCTYWKCVCKCGATLRVMGSYLVKGEVKSCGCAQRKDIEGQKFGRLLVTSFAYTKGGDAFWNVKCDCGNTNICKGSALRSNKTLSCGCSQIKDLIGMTFGKLTVIELHKRANGRAIWKCKCECGGIKMVASNQLQRGSVITCGCFVRYDDLVGKKFGRLLVEKLSNLDSDGVKWLCLCECGARKIIRAGSLASGNTKSCGCLIPDIRRLPATMGGFNALYGRYRGGAKKRNLIFNLTKEEFAKLTSSQCFYCGVLPSFIMCNNVGKGTEEGVNNSKYIYNGIDRVNNSLGYTIDNCVTCCFPCNYAKGTRSREEFISWIRKVHTRLCV